jgi:hypothetical protein
MLSVYGQLFITTENLKHDTRHQQGLPLEYELNQNAAKRNSAKMKEAIFDHSQISKVMGVSVRISEKHNLSANM